MYYVIFFIVFFATVAMMAREGMWSNLLTLINFLMAGLLAFGSAPPLAIWLDEKFDGQYTYVVDFVCLWGVFVIASVVFRLVTDRLSRTRLRLKNPLDPILSTVISLIAGISVAGFVLATLHTAPLPKDALAGAFEYSSSDVESAAGYLHPDLYWLRLVESVTPPEALGGRQFSAAAFVKIYADHRGKLEEAGSLRVKR